MRAALMSFVVLYSTILFAIAFNGCDVDGGIAATPTPHDSAPLDAGTEAASSLDASLPSQRPLSADAGNAPADARPDVRRQPLRVLAMDPETCDDESLSVPDDFIRSDERLWHLCYRTPSRDTSSSPFATQEASSVTFTQRTSWNGPPEDMIQVPADGSHVSWTASVIISVPEVPAGYPLFNARNTYGAASLWAVDGDASGRALETHGTLLAWHVQPNGRRISVPIRPVVNGCLDELMPEVLNGGSFFPDLETCPEEYYLCGPGRFHCEYEP